MVNANFRDSIHDPVHHEFSRQRKILEPRSGFGHGLPDPGVPRTDIAYAQAKRDKAYRLQGSQIRTLISNRNFPASGLS